MLSKSAYNNKEVKKAVKTTVEFAPSSAIDANIELQNAFRHRKNLLAMQDMTAMKLVKLKLEHPEWALKDILLEVVKTYPAEMPSDVLSHMTQFIFSQWEKAESLQQPVAA
jgi:hypothetical protein